MAILVGYCIVVVGASIVKVLELGISHSLGTFRTHFVILLGQMGKLVARKSVLVA